MKIRRPVYIIKKAVFIVFLVLFCCGILWIFIDKIGITSTSAEKALSALQSDDADIRAKAAAELGSVSGDEALFALMETLQNDENYSVRKAAAIALGERKDERALPALTDALYDEERRVQGAAIEALRNIGSLQSMESLLAYIPESSGTNQTSAIEALRIIGGAEAAEPLISMLVVVDSDTREEVIRQLVFLGADASEPLADALSTGTILSRRYAAYALMQIDDDIAYQAFIAALDRGDTVIIAAAYQYYIRLGRDGSENLLAQALYASGDTAMVEAYLNCGNEQLEKVAEQWAEVHHYTITTYYVKTDYPRWGED